MLIRHVILDRDGVLNQEVPHSRYITNPRDFHWIPHALEGVVLLSRAGIRISIATNQSGIGRGLMTGEQLEAVHKRMQEDVTRSGAAIDAIFACPHAPEALCGCRKPAPGLIQKAIALSQVDVQQTLVVGDDHRDLEAAKRSGVASALLRTGKGRKTEREFPDHPVPTFDNLQLLAQSILTGSALAREQHV